MSGLRFAFFGSSLISSYWNGACTYYRGIIRSLHERGNETCFYEPRAYERQEHRDIPDPDWAEVVVYEPDDALATVARARDADVIVKTSGVGVNDALLEAAVAEIEGPGLKSGWEGKPMAPNVRWIGHVGTESHNALNCSALAVLNVTRDSMVANGWSPPTRVFEAAGAGACLITDAWEGIEEFLDPDSEVLVA